MATISGPVKVLEVHHLVAITILTARAKMKDDGERPGHDKPLQEPKKLGISTKHTITRQVA